MRSMNSRFKRNVKRRAVRITRDTLFGKPNSTYKNSKYSGNSNNRNYNENFGAIMIGNFILFLLTFIIGLICVKLLGII